MGSVNTQFPPQFSLNSKNKEAISKEIRAALEEHGCIMLKWEEGKHFREEMMLALENMFTDLDPETKAKNSKADSGCTIVAQNGRFPAYQLTSAMNGDTKGEEAEKSSQFIWPQGNEKFQETLRSTKEGLTELAQIIIDIVVTSYGLDKEHVSRFSNLYYPSRMFQYLGLGKGEAGHGLPAHIDGTYLSILFQNDVHGLKVKSKQGIWLDVNFEKGSFLILVGLLFKAWSNGKLMAPEHKVVISGEKDRYSYALFVVPEADEVVEVQSKLVNDENPALYNPFLYKDFLALNSVTPFVEGNFEEFAGTRFGKKE